RTQVILEPSQEPQSGALVIAARAGQSRAACSMLAIARPHPAVDISRRAQQRLGKEGLVFEHRAKGLVEAAEPLEERPPDQGVAGGRSLRLVFQKELEELGRPIESTGRNAEIVEEVRFLRRVAPAVPYLSPSVDETGVWLGIQDVDLFSQFVRQPDIVGVQEGDEFSARPR